jgi:hypothetical protein
VQILIFHFCFKISEILFKYCVKRLTVCQIYFLLQSWHISWQTPHLLYILKLVLLLWVKNFLIVLSALKYIRRSEFSNSLVLNFVCRPTYVNLAHFLLLFYFCACFFYQLCGWSYLKSLHLIYYYVIFALLCRTLFSYLFHLCGMLKHDWPCI